MLVSLFAVAIVPVGILAEARPRCHRRRDSRARHPCGRHPAVHLDVRRRQLGTHHMLMASRLLYGMAKQNVLPSALGRVGPDAGRPGSPSSSPPPSVRVDLLRQSRSGERRRRGTRRHHGAAAAWRVRDRERVRAGAARHDRPQALRRADRAADHRRDRLRVLRRPVDRPGCSPYQIAGWLLGIGLILWILMWITNRLLGQRTAITDLEASTSQKAASTSRHAPARSTPRGDTVGEVDCGSRCGLPHSHLATVHPPEGPWSSAASAASWPSRWNTSSSSTNPSSGLPSSTKNPDIAACHLAFTSVAAIPRCAAS